jgi:RNA polymerase sigma factor (sigma-70 family)
MEDILEATCNPFLESLARTPDEELAARAQSGDREALELLLIRHQLWIFNLALRMLRLHADAEDATQDILLRAMKALPGFRGESKFTTWLYRIAANHLLNMKKAAWKVSDAVCSLERAGEGLRQVPDFDPPDPSTVPVPVEVLIEETRNHCTIGTLLCLDGRQRLVFVLGEVFGVSNQAGAEIAEVSTENFRQILSRARRDLYEYLRGNCSLVNPESHCKCARKTRAYMMAGFVDAQKLVFTQGHLRSVSEAAGRHADELMDAYMEAGASVYRNHPFYEPAAQAAMLRKVLDAVSYLAVR